MAVTRPVKTPKMESYLLGNSAINCKADIDTHRDRKRTRHQDCAFACCVCVVISLLTIPNTPRIAYLATLTYKIIQMPANKTG